MAKKDRIISVVGLILLVPIILLGIRYASIYGDKGIAAFIGGCVTIALYSILYRENPIYRMAEHIFLGLAAGYVVVTSWTEVVSTQWYDPIFHDSVELRVADFRDMPGFTARIRDARDPLAKYLQGRLSADAREALTAYNGGEPPRQLRDWLIEEVNGSLQAGSFYEEPPAALTAADLPDAPALISALSTPRTPGAAAVSKLLTPGALKPPAPGGDPAAGLLTDLNRIIDGPNLAAAPSVLPVTLSPAAQRLAATAPQGKNRARLNRMILVESMPALLAPQAAESRLAGVRMSEATRRLLVLDPQDGDRVTRLNRQILADAYPAEIGPIHRGGQWLWLWILPLALMGYFVFSRKHGWVSRFPLVVLGGLAAGQVFQAFQSQYFRQIQNSFKPLIPNVWTLSTSSPDPTRLTISGAINNVIFLITLLAVLTYFLFSFEQKHRVVNRFANLGRWLIMIGFGAIFGSTIMTRFALLVDRMYFVLIEWLKLSAGAR